MEAPVAGLALASPIEAIKIRHGTREDRHAVAAVTVAQLELDQMELHITPMVLVARIVAIASIAAFQSLRAFRSAAARAFVPSKLL